MSPAEQVNAAYGRIVKWLKAHKQAKAFLPSFRKPATASVRR